MNEKFLMNNSLQKFPKTSYGKNFLSNLISPEVNFNYEKNEMRRTLTKIPAKDLDYLPEKERLLDDKLKLKQENNKLSFEIHQLRIEHSKLKVHI